MCLKILNKIKCGSQNVNWNKSLVLMRRGAAITFYLYIYIYVCANIHILIYEFVLMHAHALIFLYVVSSAKLGIDSLRRTAKVIYYPSAYFHLWFEMRLKAGTADPIDVMCVYKWGGEISPASRNLLINNKQNKCFIASKQVNSVK